MPPVIYLAADHRGHALKERVEAYLREKEVVTVDLTPRLKEGDDYTDIAQVLADAMRESPEARGVLACGSGAGIAIAANRFRGIRATLGLDPAQVKASRSDDDVNVLVLAADFESDDDVHAQLDAFMSAPFEDNERHVRRVRELDRLGP